MAAKAAQPGGLGTVAVRRLLEALVDAVVIVDAAGRIVLVNAEAERMFGYPRAELIGQPIELLVPSSARSRHLAHRATAGTFSRKRAMGHGRCLQARRKDGTTFDAEVSLSPLETADGRWVISTVADVSDRRAAEAQLEIAEARFRGAFEEAPIGIALVARDGRLLRVNRSVCEILGRRESELLELTLDEVTHPEDRHADRERIHAIVTGRSRTCSCEKRLLHATGEPVWVNLAVSLVRGPSGEPLHFLAQIQDISHAKRIEQALSEERRLLEEAQSTARLGSWELNLETGALAWSAEQHRLHGFDPAAGVPPIEELLARVHAADRGGLRRVLTGGLDAGSISHEYRLEHPTLGTRTLLVRAALVAPEGERRGCRRLAGTTQDVTETSARDARIQMLATLVEQSEDAIIVKSTEGVIVSWNAGAERLYGYSAGEAIGRPISMLVPLDRAGEEQTLLDAALAGRSVPRYETARLDKDGRRILVSVSISPIRSPSGEIVAVSAIANDIGGRVELEAARDAAEDRLRVTVEHAPIGVALIDLDDGSGGRLLSVNRAFAGLLRAAGDREASLASVVDPEDAVLVAEQLAQLRADGAERTEFEVRGLRADGRPAWLLLTGAVVPPSREGERYAVFHAMDIGERKRFEGQLQYLADHDALTGLVNRRRFEEELGREVALARRTGSQSALLLIDLDGFKHINDTRGHTCGDQMIAQAGGLLHATLRETDVIARLGGDEFAAILVGTDQEAALAVADKVNRALERTAFVFGDGRETRVTASIGVTTFGAGTEQSVEALLVEADVAMYDAKDAGRNQARLFDRSAGPRPEVFGGRSWVERLTTALREERFELLAQPIRGIQAPGVARFELLLRLRDDDGQLVLPAAFLTTAERCDLVQQIDRWVFGKAVELLRRHHHAGHDIGLSVNMSAKTLCDPHILDDISALLARAPVPKDRLIVEVTETAAIVNIQRARQVADGLRRLGCRFALDDFGSGFASFYYLKHVGFDYLKIDGEFVKTLCADVTDQLVVKSVVDIARGLGAETIAEFVGDESALTRLKELGVDYGQGYHLGRPAPVDEALPALAQTG
jgi:diguanylate cyclase (GGDEF)-like protein/PAS domain S-box-containing protein